MNPLVSEVLDVLRGHAIVKSVRVINYDETPSGKLELKIRCRLVKNYQFQVWLHIDPTFQDYAYQLFTNRPILRWDNSPHYPEIPTAPHHFHDEIGNVTESKLLGDTRKDLHIVLSEIVRWLKTPKKT